MRTLLAALAFALAPLSAAGAPPAALPPPPPVEVMVVGVFHMSNPGHDLHNVQVDDILAAGRQTQIAAVTEALARFRPTQVAVEWPKALVEERWAKFQAGTLAPSRNEVVQLGFRLAKAAGAAPHGVDVDGDFPFEPVQAYAKAHGQSALLDAAGAATEAMVQAQDRLLKEKGVAATLRYLNDPSRLADDNAFYRTTLKIGEGDAQPGADLLTAWYRRNFLICARLVQLARPGDRMVVFYGAGHAFLLRQCVRETPGFRLVEPDAYLPR